MKAKELQEPRGPLSKTQRQRMRWEIKGRRERVVVGGKEQAFVSRTLPETRREGNQGWQKKSVARCLFLRKNDFAHKKGMAAVSSALRTCRIGRHRQQQLKHPQYLPNLPQGQQGWWV
jgi:hypothetical protein